MTNGQEVEGTGAEGEGTGAEGDACGWGIAVLITRVTFVFLRGLSDSVCKALAATERFGGGSWIRRDMLESQMLVRVRGSYLRHTNCRSSKG